MVHSFVYLKMVAYSSKVVISFHKGEGILIPKSGKFFPINKIVAKAY
jgi:hypothetical protein